MSWLSSHDANILPLRGGQRSGLRNLVKLQDDFNLKSDLQMFQQLYDGSLSLIWEDHVCGWIVSSLTVMQFLTVLLNIWNWINLTKDLILITRRKRNSWKSHFYIWSSDSWQKDPNSCGFSGSDRCLRGIKLLFEGAMAEVWGNADSTSPRHQSSIHRLKPARAPQIWIWQPKNWDYEKFTAVSNVEIIITNAS